MAQTKMTRSLKGHKFMPLTKEIAKDWYLKGYLTTTGYLLAIKENLCCPGQNLVIKNVNEFCNTWGISRSAFYRAISCIATNGDGNWQTTGTITLETTPLQGIDTLSHERDTLSHERDTLSHERDTLSHERDTLSHERDSLIYNDPARDQTIQTLSNNKDAAAATATNPIADLELTPGDVLSPEDPALQEDQVQNQNIDIVSVENKDPVMGQSCAARTNQSKTTIESVRLEDLTESDKEIYKKANNLGTTRCYNAPWRDGANIKPEALKTLFESNIEYYSLEGQKGKINRYKVASAIKKAEGQLTSSDYLTAIAAYQWLMNLTVVIETVDPTKPKYFSAAEHTQETIDMQDPKIKERIAARKKELQAKMAAKQITA